ncbi:hypothetical protein Tco_1310001 [Tanacetum coccineum]
MFLVGIMEVTDKAKEIKHLKAQIKKLKKQAKPLITHHRAWMKSISLKQRLAGKKSLKSNWMQKASVSKQGRKSAKAEPSVHKDPLFDELDDDEIDNMDTEDAQDVGRTRNGVNAEKEGTEDAVSTEVVVSTDKEKVSTDRSKVSTDRSKDSTDKEEEGTDKDKDSTVSLDEELKQELKEDFLQNKELLQSEITSYKNSVKESDDDLFKACWKQRMIDGVKTIDQKRLKEEDIEKVLLSRSDSSRVQRRVKGVISNDCMEMLRKRKMKTVMMT